MDKPPTPEFFSVSGLDFEPAPPEPTGDTRGAAEFAPGHTPVLPLTPRQRVDKFFASIGLGGLNIEHVIEAVMFDARPLPKGRERDARRMADLIAGGHRGMPDGPLIGAEDLTPGQLEELERLRPILRRMMGDAEQRTLTNATAYTQEAVRAREWAEAGRRARPHREVLLVVHDHGRERRPACNQRTRGSRRSSSRASPDDPDGSSSRLSLVPLGVGR
jgi:hypothetical protein